MTQLLEKVLKKVATLPQEKQDSLASFILAELESENRWDALFASSPDALSKLASNALTELERGETEPLDLDRDFADNKGL
jgi:hypothetical protein